MTLQLVADSLDIDLERRLLRGEFIDASEAEAIARACRLPMEDLVSEASASVDAPIATVIDIESVRMKTRRRRQSTVVGSDTSAIRLLYICQYLEWLVADRISRTDYPHASLLSLRSGQAIRALRERIPSRRRRTPDDSRIGLTQSQLHALLACIAPQSPENPFAHKFARERNALIVYWLLELGLRRGELLGAKIGDLDLRDNKLRIPRRADDPEDPRANQPNAKTLSRVVAISDELAALTRQYLTDRRHILGARKNPFIFVAESSGRPMSLSAFTSLFSEIRNACSALPRDFSAHSLRHTWNDYFSSAARAAGLSDSVTELVRSALMGWSPTSGTAASYTKRSVRESATKASLEHQARIKSIKVPT